MQRPPIKYFCNKCGYYGDKSQHDGCDYLACTSTEQRYIEYLTKQNEMLVAALESLLATSKQDTWNWTAFELAEKALTAVKVDRKSVHNTQVQEQVVTLDDNPTLPDLYEYHGLITPLPVAQAQESVAWNVYKAKADEVFGWVVGIGGYEDAIRAMYQFTASSQSAECNINPLLSRVCERGTLSCTVKHTPPPSEQAQEPVVCPECRGSEVPGEKRGVRCSTCKGSGEAPPPSAEDAKLLELLTELEWASSYFDRFGDAVDCCPSCEKPRHDGHKKDCKLNAALIAARGDGK